MIVLDTNIVLDLLVFDDTVCQPLRQALDREELTWWGTAPMREELARVLDYPQIVPRLAYYQRSAAEVLAWFDRHVRCVPVPARAQVRCRDEDDQKFIDLAVAQRATLLSKDRAVLSCAKRLTAFGVTVRKTWPVIG